MVIVRHDSGWVSQIQATDHLSAGQYAAMAEWIAPQPHSTILDIGCGPGGFLPYLADIAPMAHIVGADHDEESLDAARSLVTTLALGDRVLIEHGDVLDPESQPGPFDLVVSRQMVRHLPDQVDGLRRLAARLAPGGRLIVGEGGLVTHYLPFELGRGTPGLMHRLVMAQAIRYAGMRAELDHPVTSRYGWNVVLERAGLVVEETMSFLWDVPAPVADDARAHIRNTLLRLLTGATRRYLSEEDIETLEWLLDPANPDGVEHRRDLFILGAATLHRCSLPRAAYAS
ncbi:class I SAM-dependent methyltransferase [Herbiconiux ginsengi]|uniref:Methyltransferase domain-containing protein n=1 Tax=Herbiconiux ginsengi TaxID=381665 RepID=A0A1H3SQR3_9MICO|nr:class I SAM-dependent methyltransferase [Herbiconiux ginsengi]SDZ39915.1 Methyltransferase domain-containing protein [Herbiconiux ginsengi]